MEQFCLVRLQRFFEQVNIYTLTEQRYGHKLRFKNTECLYCAQIARPFDNNPVPFIQKHFADQIKTLLRTVRNQYLIRAYLQILFYEISLSNIFSQRQIALGRTVLKNIFAVS